MDIKLEEKIQEAISSVIEELRDLGLIVKNPEISLESANMQEIGEPIEKINATVKVSIEMYIPDKFVKVEL